MVPALSSSVRPPVTSYPSSSSASIRNGALVSIIWPASTSWPVEQTIERFRIRSAIWAPMARDRSSISFPVFSSRLMRPRTPSECTSVSSRIWSPETLLSNLNRVFFRATICSAWIVGTRISKVRVSPMASVTITSSPFRPRASAATLAQASRSAPERITGLTQSSVFSSKRYSTSCPSLSPYLNDIKSHGQARRIKDRISNVHNIQPQPVDTPQIL